MRYKAAVKIAEIATKYPDRKNVGLANVNTRTWHFLGGVGKDSFRIPITATDRETAIAIFETDYPDKKWGMTTCYD